MLTKHLSAERGDRRLKVLLAEDNPINQKRAVALIEKLGCQVEVAVDGRQALEAVQAGRFDVILMDIRMPVMNGLESTAAIRALPGDVSQIPIIAMTASAADEDIDQCKAAGMNDFLAKPIDPVALGEALQKIEGASGRLSAALIGPLPDGVIDRTVLEVLAKTLGSEKVQELVDMFAVDLPGRVARIIVARDTQDFAALSQEAHDLIGTAGNLGLTGLFELGQQMENACRNEDHEKALTLVENLGPLERQALDWLKSQAQTQA